MLAECYRRLVVEHAEGQEFRDDATKLALEALEDHGNDPQTLVYAGGVLAATERIKSGLEAIRQSIELNPNSSSAYGRLGWTLYYIGEYIEAEAALHRAIRLSPRDSEAFLHFNGLGFICIELNKFKESISWAEKGLQQRPRSGPARRCKIIALALSGQVDEAKAFALESLSILPGLSISAAFTATAVVMRKDEVRLSRMLNALRQAGLPE